MKQTLIIVLKNKGEELSRIFGVIRRLGFEIEELTMGKTEDLNAYQIRMTVQESQSGHTVEYLKKQLSRLINIIKFSQTREPKSKTSG